MATLRWVEPVHGTFHDQASAFGSLWTVRRIAALRTDAGQQQGMLGAGECNRQVPAQLPGATEPALYKAAVPGETSGAKHLILGL